MSDKPDIAEIINSYTSLEKRGDIYTGFCPFCGSIDEKLIVRPALNEWHCFQCGIGGNAEDFVALYEELILHRPQKESVEELTEEELAEEKTAATVEAIPATVEEEPHPLSESVPILAKYFSRLRKVSGYIAAAIIDGNLHIISQDSTTDAEIDFGKLNELFISIIDESHVVLGESLSTLESEIILSSDSGMVLFSSLNFREEPVHVIVLGSENRHQYLMRMQMNLLKKY